MREQCEAAADLLDCEVWSPAELALMVDSLTDGLWLRMHLDPQAMSNELAERITIRAVAAAFPSRHAEILGAVGLRSSGIRARERTHVAR